MSEGFYKRRRGVVDHLESGAIDLLDLAIHDYLNLKANLVIGNGFPWPAGIVFTSSIAVASLSPDVDERTIRRRFEKLERLGWIKTWKVPGKHGNYPVLICRASVHDVSGNEYRVSGENTTDWRHPVYERIGLVSVTCPRDVRDVSTLREVKNREKTLPPIVPQGGRAQDLLYQPWAGEIFEIDLGNRRRLMTENERQGMSGCRPETFLAFLQRKGLRCRIVPKEEVDSWQIPRIG